MAPKATPDQIFTLKTAGISNHDITRLLTVCRKAISSVCKWLTETSTTSSKPIPGRKRSVRTRPIVQAVMKRNPRRSMRKIASQLVISRSSMHRIFKDDLKAYSIKKDFRQLLSAVSKRNTMTGTKGCWQRCSHLVRREDLPQNRQLPTRRMLNCMHVMQGVCLNLVILIHAVWIQLEWWCGLQSLLMNPSPLWSLSRRV